MCHFQTFSDFYMILKIGHIVINEIRQISWKKVGFREIL